MSNLSPNTPLGDAIEELNALRVSIRRFYGTLLKTTNDKDIWNAFEFHFEHILRIENDPKAMEQIGLLLSLGYSTEQVARTMDSGCTPHYQTQIQEYYNGK
jgi:hypothetical protein